MPASKRNLSRIALLFFILFLTASCGYIKKHTLTADQTQNTNETVSDGTSVPTNVPIDTSLDQDIRTRYMEEKITRLENRIALLEKKSYSQRQSAPVPNQAYPASPAKPPQPTSHEATGDLDPVKLYNKGRALLLERNISKARRLFANFVRKYPNHELADNALYWLGECSYTTGEYEKAAEIFKTLVLTYPKGAKVPDALLKTGYAYMSMDDVSQANHYFKQVIIRYPFSLAADKAQQKLSQTQ